MIGWLLVALPALLWAEDTCWEPARQEEGISAWTCDLPESDYDAIRLETIVDRSPAWLLTLNTRAEELADWMASFKNVDVIQQAAWYDYFLHIRYAFPFPYEDRDSVTHSWAMRDPQSGRVRLQFEAAADMIPPEPDHVRMPTLRGAWTFTPLDDGRTRVVYESVLDPGGQGPAWVVNMFGLDVPFKTMVALRARTDRDLQPLHALEDLPAATLSDDFLLGPER
ncbi:START domain-containing protein [Marinobacteraceae bacterium S3BR75-40.1]